MMETQMSMVDTSNLKSKKHEWYKYLYHILF